MKNYQVEIKDFSVDDILMLEVYLDQDEMFRLFKADIVKANLEFDEALVKGDRGIHRRITTGFLELDIKENCFRREEDVVIFDLEEDDGTEALDFVIKRRLLTISDIMFIVIVLKNYQREWVQVPYKVHYMYDDKFSRCIGTSHLVCSSARKEENGNITILLGDASTFIPRAQIQDENENDIELSTAEDYINFWSKQNLETLKENAKDQGLRFNKDVTRDELLSLLCDDIKKHFKC